MGYNHEIRHRGRLFHVQTEGSGRHSGHVSTHVFHAGTIIASRRVAFDTGLDYDVARLLKDTHKSMLRGLLSGSLDEAIERRLGPSEGSGPHEPPSSTEELRTRLLELVPPPAPEVAEPATEPPTPGEGTGSSRPLERTDRLARLAHEVAGTLGVALIERESGRGLASAGQGCDIEVAAKGHLAMIEAEARVVRQLGLPDRIEDVIVTLETQQSILRLVGDEMLLCLVLDRRQGNLALARHKLAAAAAELHR
ncbi:MAG: hypothetical protein H6712_10365 [Myxococcales bacterium]|nr:hypothetical protein [Myxococcales bacterium]